MRPRGPAPFARALSLFALAALAGGCSASVSQEPITTSSLPARPAAGMVREPAPYIQTGSIGPEREAQPPPMPRYRWSESPRPTGPIQPTPPVENPQPMRWHASAHRSYLPPPRAAVPTDSQLVAVREGDTLFGLARRYGVSVAELTSVNRLDSGRIEVGQRLYVPATVR